ncbi:hypothetical protein QYF36_005356 [Acer negundo]|nr:hypothetical protein QYF36_005356 [Acer negundo]
MVALQITLFQNKGFSIGVSSHHAIFDGKSPTNFLKSWAHLCKSLIDEDQQPPSLSPKLTPSFDRTMIKDPTGADLSFIKKWFCLDDKYSSNSRSLKVFPTLGKIKSFVQGTFELTSEDLKKLRNRVEEYFQVKESKNKLHLSTFFLTCAYVFV